MKKLLLFSIALCTGMMMQAQITGYNVGDVVSDFTVTDTKGNTHNLYSITATGKYVFLDFFFVDCPPCQGTEQYFSELHEKYGCNAGDIYCLVMNTGQDDDAYVESFMTNYGGTFEHAPAISGDGGSAVVNTAFNPAAYPTYCIVGPDNKLVNGDIWPINSVSDFENAFPVTFNAGPCTSTPLTTTTTSTSATFGICDGTASVTVVTGTSPYTYSWNTSPIQTNATAIGLCPGTYIITVTDASSNIDTTTVTVSELPAIEITTSSTDATNGMCDGTASVTITIGSAPFTYSWDTNPIQINAMITGLCPGDYTVTVTDNSGNTDTSTVTVIELPAIAITTSSTAATNGECDGTASVTVTIGTPPFVYSWNTDPVQTNAMATGLCPGVYVVTVTDDSSNTQSAAIAVSELTGIQEAYNSSFIMVFYPNPVLGTAHLTFNLADDANLKLVVYNIFGVEVYRDYIGYTPSGEFNHEIDLKNLQNGSYFMKLYIDDVDTEVVRFSVIK